MNSQINLHNLYIWIAQRTKKFRLQINKFESANVLRFMLFLYNFYKTHFFLIARAYLSTLTFHLYRVTKMRNWIEITQRTIIIVKKCSAVDLIYDENFRNTP